MQTLDGTPILIHARTFTNITHGKSPILADQIGLKLVVPERYMSMYKSGNSTINFFLFSN